MRSVEPAAAPRRRLLVPAVMSLVGVALLIGLGVWQLQRREWKHALIATLDERLSAAPVALPPSSAWSGLTQKGDEFRRVRLSGTYLHDAEALVYAIGSGVRGSATGFGYLVFTPMRLADGSLVMVDRGFVPDGRKNPATRADGQVPGEVEIVGVLRWPEARPLFAPDDDPQKNIFFVRDPAMLARAKGLAGTGPLAPFYVAKESPPVPGGMPKAGPLQPHLPDNHLQYALTWFALAIGLAVIFFVWAFGGRRTGAKRVSAG